MEKETNYFPHDFNARNEDKILCMRSKYKLEGYGMYWQIIEMMYEQPEKKLSLNRLDAIAMQMHCKADKVHSFVDACSKDPINLFIKNGEFFWSESVLRRVQKRKQIKDVRTKAANKRWENEQNDNNGMQVQSKSNANALQTDAKVKQSDAKKRKGKKVPLSFFPFKSNTKNLGLSGQIKKLYEIWNRVTYFNETEVVIKLINNYGIKDVWFAFCKAKEVSTKANNKLNLDYVNAILKRKTGK